MLTSATKVILEDFNGYASDEELAKKWYKPPHGSGIRQTREPNIKSGGAYSLKFAYKTEPAPEKHYGAICRVDKWDLTGCNTLQFWLKPDGSGRPITVQLNIADRNGANIHDLWDFTYTPNAGDATPRLVSVPFSSFLHNIKYADSPDVSPFIKPADVIEVAFYIGSRNGPFGEGVYYIDAICGIGSQ